MCSSISDICCKIKKKFVLVFLLLFCSLGEDFLVLVGLEFKFRIHPCKAGAIPFEPHPLTILLWLFWRCGLFAQTAQTSIILISASQVARITGMSHQHPAKKKKSFLSAESNSAESSLGK
jgi:hypothetical protein